MSLNADVNRSEILDAYLGRVVEQRGSDLHLQTGAQPAVRVLGEICFLNEPVLQHQFMESLITHILNDSLSETLFSTGSVDFAYEVPNVARFRANFLLQHYGYGAVMRVIPSRIPTLDELDLPDILEDISTYNKGLVIVTGPTGSGKSTTLAAMINTINHERSVHIITIEDPIEFAHPNVKSMIQQRQVGVHAKSFSQALRAALRESPDIVLVGEMRDLDTISEALSAAETGHLVFGTLHTNSAAKTVDRIIDVFPADQQDSIRSMLSGTLKAVIAQQLVRTADGRGRVAVQEILTVNMGVAGLIREAKTSQIPSFITMGSKEGMQSMDQHLVKLVQDGKIAVEVAFERCHVPSTLKRAGLMPPPDYSRADSL
ncbi:MAG: type IV pilus twitching motility protein PilT [Armatimonadetes bacterium]|nr:type IV pilus twitching motility protein PilT [Armatimonadota bacterium]